MNRKFVHTGMQCCKCFGKCTHLSIATVVACDADGACWESLAVNMQHIEIVIGVDVSSSEPSAH